MALRDFGVFHDSFFGNRTFTTTPDANGWATVKVGAGTPTATTVSPSPSGDALLIDDTTSETQAITLYHKDVLGFSISQLREVYFQAALNTAASGDSSEVAYLGMASAYNSNNPTAFAWFVIGANGAISVATNDGTVNSGQKSTGYTLGTTKTLLKIDMNDQADIKFYVSDSNGTFHRVPNQGGVVNGPTPTSRFGMLNYTGSLQPFIQQGRSSNVAGGLLLDLVEVQFDYV